MICSNCRRRLREGATSCLCGKFGSMSQIFAAPIQCCFAGCIEPALCSLQTPTGRANVCRTHYPKVERDYRPRVLSEQETACRRAYEKSPHFRRIRDGLTPLESDVAVLLREPGSDEEESAAQDGGSQPVDASIERGSVSSQDAQARPIPAAPAAAGLPLGIERDPLEQEFMDAMQP